MNTFISRVKLLEPTLMLPTSPIRGCVEAMGMMRSTLVFVCMIMLVIQSPAFAQVAPPAPSPSDASDARSDDNDAVLEQLPAGTQKARPSRSVTVRQNWIESAGYRETREFDEQFSPLLIDSNDENDRSDDAFGEFDPEMKTVGYRRHGSGGARCWQLLPDGLLWHSYLAGPHEPRISSVIFYDNNNESFWDATIGGRVGLIRYGTRGAVSPRGWQWDLEGAVMTRLDMLHAQDVESMDYRFGTEITWAEGPWAAKFGYFHISSHVGDEFLLRNSLDSRINYVTESLIFGTSYSPLDVLRLYGEFANAFRASDGARRYQFQTGAEYMPVVNANCWGAPFAAINLDFRQAVDYDVSTTVQAGWAFQGPTSDRRLRIGLQYFDGPTSQFSFFRERESYIGFGMWFDY